MSIMAILSVVLGIIAIIVFIWSINAMDSSSKKGKKKNNDSSIIGMLVGLVLFFVALGVYDDSGVGMFTSDSQEQSSEKKSSRSSKNDAQREVEESKSNKSDNSSYSANSSGDTQNDSANSDINDAKLQAAAKSSNKNLKQQQEAYQQWYNQLESRLQSIDTIWSALWTDNSLESVKKLTKSLETEKTQLEAIKIPAELSATHRQRLDASFKRYIEWLDSRLKVCQMYSEGNNQQDMTNELARGDGLKMRSNVEVSNVGRELGISQ